ncbi:coiled-coil domain-containing protein 180 isoform C [Patagioenas fasciata monilis]|uniref:Coiled-coil domain-containing protein 180 isoform C n=1 Tax=Patagioenas fasciata monilis TaxID=372326 RepID=A0A1V4J6H2_PATFA|nr:coiled-coil domain-containing protein 180 isoform C [Patagioenas fasciata monilis]
MLPLGAVRLVPPGGVYKPIFEDEVRLVRSLHEVRNKPGFPIKNERLALVGDPEISPDARLLCTQQDHAERTPYNDPTEKPPLSREATVFQKAWRSVDVNAAEEVRSLPDFIAPGETRSDISERLAEQRRGRHEEALSSMSHELACIGREIEPFVLEPGKFLLTKLMESDRKIELLLKKIESGTALEGFSIEGLEELRNIIHQESLTRRKWIREMDESLKKVEWSRADKITDVLRKYTVILEKISFFLPADIHKFINNEAMLINRALLANQRAIAKLFVNLMKSEMMKDLSHRWKWQDRVKDWKLIQKNCVIRRFREFMANEDIQNPPNVKTEIENVIMAQTALSERRMELLQRLGELFPSTHKEDEIDEWYIYVMNLNKNIDTHNVQCVKKIRTQFEMVRQKCLAEMELCKNNLLNLKLCTKEEAEEIMDSEFFPLTEKLQSHFEEELEHMDRDFKELAKQNEQICRDLYSYFQEAMALWDAHQHNLSQQENELQKKLDECRRKQHILIQIMEDNLDIVLDKMRTTSSEEKLKKYLKDALSSLDDFRAKYKTFYEVLMDKVKTYPEAIFQELISYSTSVSQYFNVKEIFKQNLQGEIDFTFQDKELVEASEAECLVDQQAESIVQETKGKQKTDSCQRENEETGAAENEEIFAQETEETEEKEDEENTSYGSEGTERAGEGATFNSGKGESSEIAIETFSTSRGNSYTVVGVEDAGKTDIPVTYFTKYEKKELLPMYLKYVLIEETVFVELKKRIRLCFFEDLEKWFADAFSNSFVLVAVKKKDLDSELEQHLQLHQRRQENIETNIYNLRAVELLVHKERLENHCAEVVEALRKERDKFLKFCDQQNNISKNLRSQIRDMESVFLSTPMTEKLAPLSNSLRTKLDNHLKAIQVSLRSYQKYLEEALGKLRDSNTDFLKTCRLFVKGGEFSSDEAKSFNQCLQQESKRIDSFESLIKADMKKIESRCLQQATELIKQSETKFQHVFTNRVFMEKIQRFLRNLQVQIKSEVANSNLQAETINSYLEKLHQKIEACAHPTAEKEALTFEELCDFAQVLLKELKKRSQYLDCLLVKQMSPCDSENFSPLATDVTLQGPVAVAIRTECLRDENKVLLMGLDPDEFPVLNPSRMGKSALEDLSISFIKNLLEIQPSGKSTGLNLERKDRLPSSGTALLPPSKKSSRVSVSGERRRTSAAQIRRKSSFNQKKPTARRRKSNMLDLSDEKFQIFGEEPPESDTFKGIIMNILWTGNNNLLSLAEEFYENQQQPQITISGDLPETFEHCVEMLKQNLLSYQSQADDYYNSCLLAFQDQLTLFEKELPSVSQLAADILLREHEQKLSYSTAQIRHLFNNQMEEWENVKAVHKNQLHPSLGHPDNLIQLDTLCQKEIKRQKDQADGINLNTKMLQACAAECAQNFVSALATFTEKLLLELDECVTIDDIHVAKTDPPRQKTSTLIRHKQAALPLEISEVKQLIERGSRTWPGIPMTTLTDNSDYIICRETASITTAKTTLGHVATVEARDAVYKKYKSKLEQQFAQIKEESTTQLLTIQHWEDWWKRSVQKIKELYMRARKQQQRGFLHDITRLQSHGTKCFPLT